MNHKQLYPFFLWEQLYKYSAAQIGRKFKNNLRTSSDSGWKKVKMFQVETLLNHVIYVHNTHSKNTGPFPIIISIIIPKDARIHGQNAPWSVILDKWDLLKIQTISIGFQCFVFLFWFFISSNCSQK